MRLCETMTRHWHPTLERIARRPKPSAESFAAAAAAVYGPDLMLQLQLESRRGAVQGPPAPECDGRFPEIGPRRPGPVPPSSHAAHRGQGCPAR